MKVSLISSRWSPLTGTVIVCVVMPGAKVSVPRGGGVVAPGVARAVGGRVVDGDRGPLAARSVTVKVGVRRPALPSVTVTSLIDSVGRRVVVGDRADARAVGDRRVAADWSG